MPGQNDFRAFAAGGGANALTPSAYATLTALLANGFQTGTASSAQINTVLRQSSSMAAALGKIISDAELSALDDGNVDNLAARIVQALQTLFVSSSQANSRPGHAYGGADWCWLDRARGLALQWGYIDINGSGSRTQNITLPLTFQTNFLRSWAIDVGAACVSISSIPISGSQLRLFVPSGQIGTSNTVTTTGPIGVQWFALGVF